MLQDFYWIINSESSTIPNSLLELVWEHFAFLKDNGGSDTLIIWIKPVF